jgi:DNA-directed RNA polymerase specialized sigma24 family protein
MDDPLERVIALETHRERVQRFAGLRPRERRDLLLQAGGYRYQEIATLSGVIRCRRRLPRGAAR